MGRFQFIFGGFLLFCVGALLANTLGVQFLWSKFLLGYLILFTAHLSLHYSNDYFDIEVDKHTKPTMFTGGTGILVENPQLARFSKLFSIILIACSLFFTIIFILIFNQPILIFFYVLLSDLLSWFYSAPPLKLVYRGWGEISCIIAVGILMPGLGFLVMNGNFDLAFLIFSLPLIFYGIFFIMNVEIPDMEGDKLGDKNTFIVKKGRKHGFKIVGASAALASLSFIFLNFTKLYPASLNFLIIIMLSLIVLFPGLWSFIKNPENKIYATKLVNNNLTSLILFLISLNCYLVYVILNP
jgi:1,4-dihydroxy-2-naphthoate polyprenyltransferase